MMYYRLLAVWSETRGKSEANKHLNSLEANSSQHSILASNVCRVSILYGLESTAWHLKSGEQIDNNDLVETNLVIYKFS